MPFTGGSGSGGATTVSGAVEADRKVTTATLTIAQGAAVSDALDMRDYAAALVTLPAAWTAADLGVQVCATADGTFVPLLDASGAYGTDVSIDGPVASKSYIVPLFAFAAHFIKLWSHDGAGENTVQEAARTLTIQLKS
ncbi:MAG: hypothetical protein IT450_24205 [Phycisphaerales bacterium]|nr:hypothetical protein [Phycisphaerales bacterium]